MATPELPVETTLRLERSIQAAPEAVFDAWTRAESLASWFAPSDEHQVVVHALDPRPGGRYRIEMRHVSGRRSIVGGIYREVTRPSRLAFTWAWEEGPSMAEETLVTVALAAEKGGTRLVLTHERFPNAAARDEHQKGWGGCLARLEGRMQSR
jgi:uncharacterized protein YndB with AHSA1/START domain